MRTHAPPPFQDLNPLCKICLLLDHHSSSQIQAKLHSSHSRLGPYAHVREVSCDVHARNWEKPNTRIGEKRKDCNEEEVQFLVPKIGRVQGIIYPTAGGVWKLSKCINTDLQWLVLEGILQEQDVVEWHMFLVKMPFPLKIPMKLYFLCILLNGDPPSNFFRVLFHLCKLKLNHLNPNSNVHFSIFVYFCEAFLGI